MSQRLQKLIHKNKGFKYVFCSLISWFTFKIMFVCS